MYGEVSRFLSAWQGIKVCHESISHAVSRRTALAAQVMQTHGRERTRQEYERLFVGAGFQLRRIVRTRGPLSVTEAVPV